MSYLMNHKLRVLDEKVIETLREVGGGLLETHIIQHILPLLAQLLGYPAILCCLLEELNHVFCDNGLETRSSTLFGKETKLNYFLLNRGEDWFVKL